MASLENSVWKRTLLRLAKLHPMARLFRNNRGTAYAGPGFTMKRGQTYTAEGGERVITRPRLIEFGLTNGSGDGIGWQTVTITPDMIGKRIAVFLSVETKSATGKPKKEQINWRDQVQNAGGIAVIISDAEQLDLRLPNIG